MPNQRERSHCLDQSPGVADQNRLNYQELQVIVVLVASWPYMLYVAFMTTRQESTIQIGAMIVGSPRRSQRSSRGRPPKL
jgi:hypothetical protein